MIKVIEAGNKCVVYNCKAQAVTGALCSMHYKRQQRHNSTDDKFGVKTINGTAQHKHPLYTTWRSMTRAYAGKFVCTEWLSFINFIASVGAKPEGKVAFKRLDTSKNFMPGNVIWVSPKTSQNTRDKRAAYMRKYNAANIDYQRAHSRKSRYGITELEYNALSVLQNNTCAICKQPETSTDYKNNRIRLLAVDHCHTTGKVRGLLCHSCNTSLGHFKDNIDILKRAIEYLQK